MNGDDFSDLLDEIKCGKFACLRACCNELIEFSTHVRNMNETQFRIAAKALCRPCAPNAGAGPGGGAGSPDPRTCLRRLQERVCSERGQVALNVLRGLLLGAVQLIPDDELRGMTMMFATLVQQVQSFCSSPEGGKVDVLLRGICVAWPKVRAYKDFIDKLAGTLPIFPLKSAVDELFASGIASALDECCAANNPPFVPAPGTGGEPGGGAPGGGAVPRPWPQLPSPTPEKPNHPGNPLPPGPVTPPQLPPGPGDVLITHPSLLSALRPFATSSRVGSPPSGWAWPPGPRAYYVAHDPDSGTACFIDPDQADKGMINERGERCFAALFKPLAEG